MVMSEAELREICGFKQEETKREDARKSRPEYTIVYRGVPGATRRGLLLGFYLVRRESSLTVTLTGTPRINVNRILLRWSVTKTSKINSTEQQSNPVEMWWRGHVDCSNTSPRLHRRLQHSPQSAPAEAADNQIWNSLAQVWPANIVMTETKRPKSKRCAA